MKKQAKNKRILHFNYNIMPIDYKKYAKNWKTEIRPKILQRARNKCEFCWVENYAIWQRDYNWEWHNIKEIDQMGSCEWEMMFWEYKPIKIILTIAHLDHNIDNNNDDNLKALCQKCHLNYDKIHHIETRTKNKKPIIL